MPRFEFDRADRWSAMKALARTFSHEDAQFTPKGGSSITVNATPITLTAQAPGNDLAYDVDTRPGFAIRTEEVAEVKRGDGLLVDGVQYIVDGIDEESDELETRFFVSVP